MIKKKQNKTKNIFVSIKRLIYKRIIQHMHKKYQDMKKG